jgi:raffinose/stachyose/melibiose transport system permease protein
MNHRIRIENYKERITKGVIYLFLALYGTVSLLPFVWALISSLKDNDSILRHPFSLPKVFLWMNYPRAWTEAHLGLYTFNTATYAVLATSIILVISTMAAYVVSRVKPSLLLYTYFTLGIMIPVHTVLLPAFILVRNFGLFNTRLSIIIVYVAFNLSLSFFIMYGFLKGIPYELEEAALIDGCSRTRTFFAVIFPLAQAGLATTGVLTFLNLWNEFLMPLILLTSQKLKVITNGINDLREQYGQNYGLIGAGLCISFLPMIVIYIAFQEQVIKGMMAGAVKG